jgi:hypothetical protein
LYGGPKYAAAGDVFTPKSSAAAIPEDAMKMAAAKIDDGLGNPQVIMAPPDHATRAVNRKYVNRYSLK